MAPHILRIPRTYYATYVRGYGDGVFQTHGIMWLSILTSPASPRTYYAPLCMYGVTEIASSRRIKQKKAPDCSDAFSYFGFNYYP